MEAWKKHASDVLPSWVYSYDAEQKINIEETYNIKKFPTLYLIDKDKKVLLKDATFVQLTEFFKMINN
jgi:hypothetical protein